MRAVDLRTSPAFDRFAGVFSTNIPTAARLRRVWADTHVGPLCPRRRPCGPVCAEFRERDRVLRAGVVDAVRGLSRAERAGVRVALIRATLRMLLSRTRRQPPGDHSS